MLHVSSPSSTMTLGLERKLVACSPPTTTTTTTGTSTTSSKTSKVKASDKMLPSTSTSKPKTILSCNCSELKSSCLKVVHSVQLLLTSYEEILVLKRGDKSRTQTVLRRHGIASDIIEEHSILPFALLVKVPNTLLTYVYQLDKEKTLKQWMNKIDACKKKAICNDSNGYLPSSESGRVKDTSTTSASSDSTTTATSTTAPHGGRSPASHQSPNNPATSTTTAHGGRSPVSHLSPNYPSTSTTTAHGGRSTHNSSYACGPDSPVSSSYLRNGIHRHACPVSFTSSYLPGPSSPILSGRKSVRSFLGAGSGGVGRSNDAQSNGCTPTTMSGRGNAGVQNGSSIHDTDSLNGVTCAVSMRGDINSTEDQLNQDDSTEWNEDNLFSIKLDLDDSIDTELNQNESTNTEVSRDDSTISELTRDDSTNTDLTKDDLMLDDSTTITDLSRDDSINIELMHDDADQVSEETGPSLDHHIPPSIRSSSMSISRSSSTRSSGRSDADNESTRMLNLSSLEESLEMTSHQIIHQKNMSDSLSLDRNMSLNLCLDGREARQTGFMRRASDQFLGIIKMRSLREKESRKMVYVKKASSSTSELDAMAETNIAPSCDFTAEKSRRTTTSTSPIPTPTSPLRTTSPAFPHIPGGHTSGDEMESEGAKEFVVSRFHHTQIRNRKWKQSPRIQRNVSVQSSTESSGSKEAWSSMEGMASSSSHYDRSLSESPTSVAGRAIHGREYRSHMSTESFPRSRSSALGGYATPPSQSSTLPRSMKGGRRRLNSEQESGGVTTPNSPVPFPRHIAGGGAGIGGSARSPKLLRIFHRRATSGTIKFPLDLSDMANRGSVESDITSSFNLEHNFKDTMPKRLHQFPAKDVAMEMTLVDSELLRKIRPEELVDGAWIKKETKEEKAVNVLCMVRSFNQLALLVPTEILSETTPNARSKVITAFIQIARRCYVLHNYNSLKAVLAGLQCTPIYRLKKTWKEVASKRKKQFDQMCDLMSESDNWELYRNEISRLVASDTAFIPFLGMFLTQVVQNDSYHQIRNQTSGSKVTTTTTNTLSTSYSDHTSTSPPNTLLTSKNVRRRSASLGDSCPLVVSPSDINPSLPPGCHDENGTDHIEFSCSIEIASSDFEQVFLEDSLSYQVDRHGDTMNLQSNQVHLRNDSMDELDLHGDMVDGDLIKPKNKDNLSHPDHTRPTVAIEIVDEDEASSVSYAYASSNTGLVLNQNHQNHHKQTYSGSEETKREMEEAESETEGEELNLEDISFGFKRRSLSFESLLDSYKEDVGLQKILHSSLAQLEELSSTIHSLSEDEYSDHEMYESSLLDTTASDCLSCDLESSLSCSFNSSHLDMTSQNNQLMDMTSQTINPEMTTRRQNGESRLQTDSNYINKSRSIDCDGRDIQGVDVVTPPISMMTPLDFMPRPPDTCPISAPVSSIQLCRDTPPDEGGVVRQSGKNKRTSPVKRSKSQNTKPLRRKNKAFLKRSKLAPSPNTTPTLAVTPSDMLIRFQIAAMGCIMGVDSREELRTVLNESETNSEKDNYTISHDREKEQ